MSKRLNWINSFKGLSKTANQPTGLPVCFVCSDPTHTGYVFHEFSESGEEYTITVCDSCLHAARKKGHLKEKQKCPSTQPVHPHRSI